MNKEQYEKIKPFEQQVIMVCKGNCLVGVTPREANAFIDVYNEVFNRTQQYTTCSHCLFKIFKSVGNEYLKYQEEHPEPTPTEKPVNKRGRKKKDMFAGTERIDPVPRLNEKDLKLKQRLEGNS